jgi:hypothetical protein
MCRPGIVSTRIDILEESVLGVRPRCSLISEIPASSFGMSALGQLRRRPNVTRQPLVRKRKLRNAAISGSSTYSRRPHLRYRLSIDPSNAVETAAKGRITLSNILRARLISATRSPRFWLMWSSKLARSSPLSSLRAVDPITTYCAVGKRQWRFCERESASPKREPPGRTRRIKYWRMPPFYHGANPTVHRCGSTDDSGGGNWGSGLGQRG